jgi:hypothetical protein
LAFWDRFVEQLRTFGDAAGEWAVLIVLALVVLIVGRWILKLVRNLIERLLGANWLDGVWERSGAKQALAGTEQTPASITATIVYAYLLVVLLLIVAGILNLVTIERLLERLLLWVPQLLLAAIVVLVAAAAAAWTAEVVRPFASERGVPWLAGLVRVAIVVVGVLFALEIVNITFAEEVLRILVAAVGIALAIAFGVGGIDTAKKWWARYGEPDSVAGSRQPSPRDFPR